MVEMAGSRMNGIRKRKAKTEIIESCARIAAYPFLSGLPSGQFITANHQLSSIN
jgi:hypothetical protein